MTDEAEPVTHAGQRPLLLPKDRTILEREVMLFRPFGLDELGQTIRDISGMSVRATMLELERTLSQQRGAEGGREAVAELCALLNGRIRDPVYHVTPEFLKNPWNSYSYEFAAYLYEFCERLTGNPQFVYHGGMEKVSPMIQVLARPFSLQQIYGMFPYFGNKFASGSVECRVIGVAPVSATLAMRFADRTLRQFGPYRRRCAHLVCQSAQGICAAVPVRVHGLPPATITNLTCVADDDDWCRWVVEWQPERRVRWPVRNRLKAVLPELPSPPQAGAALPVPDPTSRAVTAATGTRLHQGAVWDFRWETPSRAYLGWLSGSGLAGVGLGSAVGALGSAVDPLECLLAGLAPVVAAGLLIVRHWSKETGRRDVVIQEQMSSAESRHEELREAYLEQEQTRVELRRRVAQLTTLHRAGLLFSSTLDRETLLQQVLETLTRELHYDRAMISFFNPSQGVLEHARVIGLLPEAEAFARTCRIAVEDPGSPEGMVVLQGQPVLLADVRTVKESLHPLNQRLIELSQAKALIIVPLKTKSWILGTLMVDRVRERSLSQDDLELMTTVANQVAIALDNASAYHQIEEWNTSLEGKVRERTAALERADRMRSQFLSHVSHELKTPLTSIKGYLQNLLDGLTGPVNDRQTRYLGRMLDNSDRLIRMINDLLDLTRIESGRLELEPGAVDLEGCLVDAVEQLRPLASAKRQTLAVSCASGGTVVWADRDRVIQVVVNLGQNAIKFTPEQGMITVAAERLGECLVRIAVRDTGPGIPAGQAERIFDPFFRAQHGQRSGPKGLGLGLSIVKTLVESQGGTVSAGNHSGGGAEVAFTLPVRAAGSVCDLSIRGEGRRILVVDDDPDIRQWLSDRLRAEGYDPRVFADGQEALEAFRAEACAGVILDIGIGPIDGLEVLRRIREADRSTPVVMITASGSRELATQALGFGAQAYLLKPFDAGDLQRVLDTWFARGQEGMRRL